MCIYLFVSLCDLFLSLSLILVKSVSLSVSLSPNIYKHLSLFMSFVIAFFLSSARTLSLIFSNLYRYEGDSRIESLGTVSFLSDLGTLDERAKALSAFRWVK